MKSIHKQLLITNFLTDLIVYKPAHLGASCISVSPYPTFARSSPCVHGTTSRAKHGRMCWQRGAGVRRNRWGGLLGDTQYVDSDTDMERRRCFTRNHTYINRCYQDYISRRYERMRAGPHIRRELYIHTYFFLSQRLGHGPLVGNQGCLINFPFLCPPVLE